MTFTKFNARGAGHLLLPLLVVVVTGVIGAYLVVASHADPVSRSVSTYFMYPDGGAYDGVRVSSSGFAGASCKKQALPKGKSILFALPHATTAGKPPALGLVCTTPSTGSYSVSFVKNGVVPAVAANPQKPVILSNKTTACLLVHSSNSSNGQGITRTLLRSSTGKCTDTTTKTTTPAAPRPSASTPTPTTVARPKVSTKTQPVKPHAVYMVGDSITLGAKAYLNQDLLKEYKQVKINSSTSRSITGPGTTGDKTSGLQAITGDRAYIKHADTIIIALGTNYNNDFENSIKNLIKQIKSCNTNTGACNSSADIYWVTIFSQGPVNASQINASLTKLATPQHYKLIQTVGKGISLSPDHVHPDPNGSKKFAQIVAAGAQPTP